jgi:hypothetical protein
MSKGWIASFLLLSLKLIAVLCGHEVLSGWNESHPLLFQPEELLVVQYDSRPLNSYWNTSAQWNKRYCNKYGHLYLFFSSETLCRDCFDKLLASPWCKVKAMVAADIIASPSIKFILYLDSDTIITVNQSLSTVISYIQADLHWDVYHKPLAFNQDGPGYSCKQAYSLGYMKCFNSGTVLWFRNTRSSQLLRKWWQLAAAQHNSTLFPMNWKVKWPWEQAQQHELFASHHANIMVLSFPNLPYLPWTSRSKPKSQYPTDAVEPYCFSHWPGANCFITHFCASLRQKMKMHAQYSRNDAVDIQPVFLEKVFAESEIDICRKDGSMLR